jgi:cbb3-type cytochrome oxidase subunit 3
MSQLTSGYGFGFGDLGGLLTAAFFLTFLYWTWTAYSPWNRAMHEKNGQIPLDDEGGV